MSTRHAAGCLTVVLVLTTLMGCQSLDMGILGTTALPTASPENPVTQIVCLWEPAEGIGLDNLPTRGFAAQILFFTGRQPEPVRVDGDVQVYLFDNHGTREEQGRPIHEFQFPADAWDTHLRETNLGATYQLFIPYTRKGGYGAECVLRVRFTPENGFPIYSKMSTLHLAGRSAPSDVDEEEETTGAQTVELDSTPPSGPVVDDLVMPINTTDITSRQPASLSLQRGALPDIGGLDAAITEVLRESATVEVADDVETIDDSPTGRYSLSGE